MSSGVYMNMVTKSGGNRFTSDHNFYFMNDALQGNNIDDDLRAAPRPRRRGSRPAPPATRSTSATTGARRWAARSCATRPWFFGAIRWWRLDQFQIGALNPDGSQAIDDNRIRNFVGKVTWQATPNIRTSFLFNKNINDRFHRRDSPYLFVEDKATDAAEPAGAELRRAVQPGGRLAAGARRAASAGCGASSRCATRPTCGRPTSPSATSSASRASTPPRQQSLNPNDRYQGNLHRQLLPATRAGAGTPRPQGRPAAVVGADGVRAHPQRRHPASSCSDGVPFQAQLANTPINSDHRLKTWGVFLQDRWVLGRATINAGVRVDGVSAYLPAQSSPAGTFVERAQLSRRPTSSTSVRTSRRASASPTTCSATAAPRSRPTTAASTTSSVRRSPKPPTPTRIANQAVAWTDTNGNLRARSRRARHLHRLPARPVPDRGPTDASRPYSDEFNVGVEQQLAGNMALSASATTAASTATASASSTAPAAPRPTRRSTRTYVDP